MYIHITTLQNDERKSENYCLFFLIRETERTESLSQRKSDQQPIRPVTGQKIKLNRGETIECETCTINVSFPIKAIRPNSTRYCRIAPDTVGQRRIAPGSDCCQTADKEQRNNTRFCFVNNPISVAKRRATREETPGGVREGRQLKKQCFMKKGKRTVKWHRQTSIDKCEFFAAGWNRPGRGTILGGIIGRWPPLFVGRFFRFPCVMYVRQWDSWLFA